MDGGAGKHSAACAVKRKALQAGYDLVQKETPRLCRGTLRREKQCQEKPYICLTK